MCACALVPIVMLTLVLIRLLSLTCAAVALQINDRYEFYDELDLDREDEEGRPKYLSQGADTRAQNKYRLHSGG